MSADPDGRSLILAIGLDGYQAFPRLVGAARGAESTARLLWRRFRYEASVLIDQHATRGAVNRELDRLQQADRVVIYYAGRLLADRTDEPTLALYTTSPDNPATGLELTRLLRIFNALPARHALLILDAPIDPAIYHIDPPAVESTEGDRTRTILAAGMQAWQSRDLWGDNDTSLFTAQIGFGLSRNAADSSGQITLSALIAYVIADVKRASNGSWIPWALTLPGSRGEWVIQAEAPVELPAELTDGLRSGFSSVRNRTLGDIAWLIERGTVEVKALAIAKLREVAADNDQAVVRKTAVNELLARNIPVTEENFPVWREPAPERLGISPLPMPSEQPAAPLPGDRRSTMITIGIAIGVLATAIFVMVHFSP